MPGTTQGGLKAREKNLAKDPDFYKKIGAIGGKKGTTGGFGQGEIGRQRASKYGRIGGLKSRRHATSKTYSY